LHALKTALHIALFLLFPFLSLSQDFYIKGQVKDEAGNALQRVRILLHSTGNIYFSGTEGLFGILCSNKSDTLTFLRDGTINTK
jgi:Ca-activated chloride channel family protein